VKIDVPDHVYGQLAKLADKRGIKIGELLAQALAKSRLPPRPDLGNGWHRFAVDADREGWTTAEMSVAFGVPQYKIRDFLSQQRKANT
jgi:hypothetical protein